MRMDAIVSSSNSKNFSSNSFFTPLFISILGIGATALAILMYHLLVVRYCMRRQAARMASIQNLAGEGIPTGVDEKTLLTIPIITYTRPDSVKDEYECAVCLGDVENGDMVRCLPNCKHMFHVKCIDEWFVGHTSCPVCRVPVVAPDDEVRSCPVCRSSVGALTDDRTSVGSTLEGDDQTDAGVEVLDGNGGELTSGPRIRAGETLRHCNSLVLPRETKERLSGMELKRSLSMGQSTCVTIDIQIDNADKDCEYYSSIREQSVRGFLLVSSKVRQSISRMCVAQGSAILPY
ncbi:hypothetical protein L1887_19393 [Cichorium endivia]|nr:hypothetical protein L1887_19393 [Cichorium endivia]